MKFSKLVATGILSVILTLSCQDSGGDSDQQDNQAPTFVGNQFTRNIGQDSASIPVTLNESGVVKYILKKKTDAAPSLEEVQAQGKEIIVAEANTPTFIQLEKLEAGTEYIVYLLAIDTQGNVQDRLLTSEFKTSDQPDLVAPSFLGQPNIVNLTNSSAKIEVALNEDGTIYYILRKLSDPGSSVDIDDLKNSKNSIEFLIGANAAKPIIQLNGLEDNTEYTLHLLAKDSQGNFQKGILRKSFITNEAPDTEAPVFLGTPVTADVQDTKAEIVVILDEPSTVRYVVQKSGEAAPSLNRVLASSNKVEFEVNNAIIKLDGLERSTSYDIYLVAVDVLGNSQDQLSLVTVTTKETPDTTAPVFTDVPRVIKVDDTQAEISVSLNEKGAVKYLIQKEGLPAPSRDDVLSSTVMINFEADTALIKIESLEELTSYDVYLLATDIAGNTQSRVTKLSLTTRETPDTDAPLFVGSPLPKNITDVQAEIAFSLNEKGSVKYIVQESGAAAPSLEDVLASNVMIAYEDGDATIRLEELEQTTSYDIYLLATDSLGNHQEQLTKVTITTKETPDTEAPTFVGTPSLTSISDTSAVISFSLNETGSLKYLVQKSGQAAPNLDDVLSSSVTISFEGGNAAIELANLEGLTSYDIYLLAMDSEGNQQDQLTKITITTEETPDTEAPKFDGNPEVNDITDTKATVEFSLNEKGSVKYIAVKRGQNAPSIDDVIASTVQVVFESEKAMIELEGLEESTSYDVYLIATDYLGNAQNQLTKVSFATLATPDTEAPSFVGAPRIENVTDTRAEIRFSLNEKGQVKYVLREEGAGTPSLEDVAASNIMIAFTSGEAVINLSGLEESTNYSVYLLAIDESGNEQTALFKVSLKTKQTPDTRAPVFVSAPEVTEVTQSTAEITLVLNEKATVKYLVRKASESAPSVRNVLDSTVSIIFDRESAKIALNQLAADTSYTVYLIATDEADNSQTQLTSVQLKTGRAPDREAPSYVVSPRVSNITDSKADVSFRLNEAGTLLYVLRMSDETAPSYEDVKNSNVANNFGTRQTTINLRGLLEKTDYTIYMLAKDRAENYQSELVSVTFTTDAAADTTAPVFLGLPRLSSVDHRSARLTYRLNEKGIVKIILRKKNESAPSIQTVKNSNRIDNFANTGNGSISLGDLDSETDYIVYLLAADTERNYQDNLTKVEFKTDEDPVSSQTEPLFDSFSSSWGGLCYEVDVQTGGDNFRELRSVEFCKPSRTAYARNDGKCYEVASDIFGDIDHKKYANEVDQDLCGSVETESLFESINSTWGGLCYEVDSQTGGDDFRELRSIEFCKPSRTA